MESTQATPPEPDIQPLRPLTKKTVEGELYTRPPKHEKHVHRALSVPVHEFESWIRSFGYGETRYADLPKEAPSPEALVYLYRHFRAEIERFKHERRAQARARAERILKALLDGIHAAAESHVPGKLGGVPPNRRKTCVDEVMTDLLVRLNRPGDAADPLEVVFGLYMKRLTDKTAEKYRKRAMAEVAPFDTLVNHEDDTADPARLLDRERVKQMVEYLSPKHKLVVQRLILQQPVPTQADLADEVGVSERTIRNRLYGAKAALRKLLSEDNQ